MNHPYGPLTTDDFTPRPVRSRKFKMELHGSLAGIFILWSVGFAFLVEVAGAPHYDWHNYHYYVPLACALPFSLRFLWLWLITK